ncbi:MAG: T9SS type A sorting domain-containing protein, partial [Saprospiraceae bacterium]|nr:T9SS type A sorting domain-containing protein [Saprospiraceae bacterium]MCB0683488.1 T9SS type A sorting domain-containing protein [Saprospiraceae bacterium]
ETYSYTFTTYTIPSSMNWENMHIAAVMHDANNNGRSINAWQKTVLEATTVGTKDVIVNHDLARVAPNPFNDVTNVYLSLEAPAEVNMRVFNAVGQEIAARNYGTLNGQQVLPFDGTRLDAGVYFIHLMVDNTLVTKKVMLAK